MPMDIPLPPALTLIQSSQEDVSGPSAATGVDLTRSLTSVVGVLRPLPLYLVTFRIVERCGELHAFPPVNGRFVESIM
jgi:hypothetical protein